MEMNPYAAPQSQVICSTTQDEAIRRQHLNTEAAIKSVGSQYYLGAILLTIGGVAWTASGVMHGGHGKGVEVILGGITLAIGIAYGVLANGLSTLKSWTRVPTIILSSFGLIVFPSGTLISIYILVKVAGQQGKFILSPEYQRIIAATPQVRYKTSKALWVVLILLVLVLLGMLAFSMLRQYQD
jgi:hypothetical protein